MKWVKSIAETCKDIELEEWEEEQLKEEDNAS